MGLERFTELVQSMSKEWNEKQGRVTCELSTSTDQLEQKLKIIAEASVTDGMWVMRYCTTCLGHDAGKPIHVEIVK